MDKIYAALESRSGEKIEIKKAAPRHAEQMLALEDRSIDPVTFARITREEMLESMEEDLVLAAFVGDKIVALNIILRNRESDRSLAKDLGRDPREVATFDGVIVAPEYRGLGLQRIFLSLAEQTARDWGAKLISATVSAKNAPSRNNFSRSGFTEIGEFPKYGSTRIIVTKEL